MMLLVGLGNPGGDYAKTRHNLGARVVDALRQTLELPDWKREADLRGRSTKNSDMLLVLPATFMNASGDAVARFAQWYAVPAERIWIVSDDVDLPFLETRSRTQGSAGGHQGLQSVIDALKTERFNRFRIGIGSNRPLQIPAEAYVLEPFTAAEEAKLLEEMPRLVAELHTAIEG